MANLRPDRIPLRLRLTVWYTLALGLILALFAIFLYFQVRRSLIDQVDASLHLAANQALIGVGNAGGRLAFQPGGQDPDAIRNLNDDFVIQLLAEDGTILGTLNNDDQIPVFPGQEAGFSTRLDVGEAWRVYRQTIEVRGISGWIQAAQELDPVDAALADLRAQIYWALPLALLLSGAGGYFLASRALRPIGVMTRTAQAITAGDLGQRIHHHGPADEIGRLAQTFDTMLDRLQAAFERERQFTGDAAHELRTPLTALKGRLGVTLSRPRQPAAYRQALQEMEGQVDRLIRLSNDLLFMARLEQGQLHLRAETIDLANLMAAAADQVRPLAEARNILLAEDTPAGLALRGDMDLLLRLLLNLLDNAIKYTPENGRVTLQARVRGDELLIAVSDTGPGIDAGHLPHLFERFYRAEEDRARNWSEDGSGGAGLGLAIASEIARFHGGRLSVESEVGRGSTFIIQLPAGQVP